ICCSLFTFLYVRELFGTAAGLVAGTLSVYAPYLLYNLYQSGDFSQTLALPLLPLVFWAFHRLIARPSRRRFGAAALAYGGLLLAHNVTFLVASPFLAAYCLVLLVRYRAGWAQRAMAACGAAVLGLGVSAVYWLPVFADAASVQLTRFHTEPGQDYRQNFVRLTELVSSRVLHAYNGVVFTNRFGPAQMGLVQTTLIAAAMAGLALAWRSDGWTRGLGLLFGLATASALFLNTHWSAPLWSIFPGAAFVQQPIRLLSLAGFFGALTVGAGVSRLPRGAQLGLAGPLVLFVGLAGGAGLTNLRYLNMPAHLTLADALAHERVSGGDYLRHFLPVAATTTLDWSPELLPIALGHSPLAVLPGELPPFARVVDQQRTSLRDTVNLQSSRPFTVRMERLYWTGWQATINGQPARVFAEANSGLLQVAIPAGTSHVVVWLGSTLVRQVALALSLVCCLLTLILGWPSQPVPRLALAAGLPLAAVLLPLALVGVGTELGAAPRSIRPLNVQYGPAELTSAQVMQVSPTTIRARLHWGAVPPAGSTVRVLAGSSGHPWAEATGPGSQQEFALTLPVGMPFDAYFVQIDLFDTHGSLLMPTSARRMYMYPLVQHVQIGALFLGSLPAPSLPGTPELRVRVFASATQGAAIPVDLAWTVHAKHQPANPSLHLVDAAGNLWAQN
ncbi:MAG: hypothetical protein ACRDF8_07110, partial [Chloroflexota bacterium]